MTSATAAADTAPPRLVWLMCFTNLSYGFGYAAVLLTMGQMLRERGMAQSDVSTLVSLALLASLFAFLLAPVLDTMVSRRTWATWLLVTISVGLVVLFRLPAHSPLVRVMMPLLALSLSMYTTSLGGWLGAGLPKSADKTVATWFNIANGSGFGAGALVQYPLVHSLPGVWGPLAIGALVLLPGVLFPLLPLPDAGRNAVRESFGRLGHDILKLVRMKHVLRILLLFLLPCASFALTNTVGSLGSDFATPAHIVDLSNGVGTWAMAVVAGLATQQLIRRVHPLPAYVGIGIIGALFTLVMALMPHIAVFYVIVVLGENAAQSAAFTAQNAVVFGSIVEGSPLAATQFGLLSQAAATPLTYMQFLDGQGYNLPGAFHGVLGTFFVDAGVSVTACLLVLPIVRRWVRSGVLEARPAEAPA